MPLPTLRFASAEKGVPLRDLLDSWTDGLTGPFARLEDRLLFEYASGIGLGESVADPAWVPSPEQAGRLGRESRIAVWRCWSGMALKESAVFLGTEDVAFNKKTLPYNIESDYLPLYLYTLHQALRVVLFSE